MLADGRGDGVGVAAGGHDVVPGGQGRAGELHAHAATGAGDKPSLCHGLDGRSAHGPQRGAVSPPQSATRRRLNDVLGVASTRGSPPRDPGVSDVAPGAGHARAGRALRARRRCSTGAGAASRGGRRPRRRERRLLHPARTRRRRRRVRQRAQRRRARTAPRRCRTAAPLRPRAAGGGDTPGVVARLDPPERAADPRRVHRRHGPRPQPTLGLPRRQRAGPRRVLGHLRRPDRPAEPRPLRVPRRPRPELLRRLARRRARHRSHPALRSGTRSARSRARTSSSRSCRRPAPSSEPSGHSTTCASPPPACTASITRSWAISTSSSRPRSCEQTPA